MVLLSSGHVYAGAVGVGAADDELVLVIVVTASVVKVTELEPDAVPNVDGTELELALAVT